ncbi:3-deoxy-D-manno-octulosonic acid transferase [Litoribacter ruber]|uniref:3-deoxy-D-manno-octulosonic acid transferase n=1 Tax=Litoribacter ruber TaxID=702568 RepID=UPI001FEA715A|nr:glycosyltransferase N-terminal domain-containing protein [Litoribacter ruber]
MKRLYDLSMQAFELLFPLVGRTNAKLQAMVEGRKGVFGKLAAFKSQHEKVIWFHVASLGEYEQAKPVMAKLKEKSDAAILLTFFSSSGYENVIRKKQPSVDGIFYLPFDTVANADRFVKTIQPKLALFAKYDIWPNYMKALQKHKVPAYLFSAAFREEQSYFKKDSFLREAVKSFSHIFTQNEKSLELLKQIGYQSASFTGDTRFDNVKALSENPQRFPVLEKWIGEQPVLVVGSAWQEDMDCIIPFINKNRKYKYIIAPHEIKSEKMGAWRKAISKQSELYSNFKGDELTKVVIIDNVGMLSSLYQYAEIAFVGGAFGKGLHNILEPIAYGIPVLFGKLKKVGKFPEAAISQKYGCGFEVSGAEDFLNKVMFLQDEEVYKSAQSAAKKMVEENLGSAQKIVDHIMKEIKG